jgi:hypothetical protein
MGWLASAGLALALCGPAQAQDDPPGRVGRIGELQGEVWVFDVEQGDWVAAVRNRPFTQGDRLSTAEAGRVELNIGSTTLFLGSGAELEALRLDDERIQLQLHRGSLALRLRSQEVAGELQVFTGEGRFAFQRSGLYRVNRHDETSDASVWRGDLSFQTDDFLLPLQAGQAAEFWRDGPQRIPRSRWLTPQNDDFALAVLRQDQAAERSVSAQYVSPEMTGIEDLDRHGSWQQHPEYGAIWAPTVVSVGWAPYQRGHWAWVQPWGWTWVDDAAWGFAPFHYGRWLWWGSRWCWAPGPRVARPVYAPALVGWIGGGRLPHSGSVRSRTLPGAGWVPLAPREAYRPGYRGSAGYLDRINVGRPHPHGPAPEFGNRYAPGAFNSLPGQSMVPRQGGGAFGGGPPRPPGDRVNPVSPAQPAVLAREQVAPRASIPLVTVPQRAPWPSPEGWQPRRDGYSRPGGQGDSSAAAMPQVQQGQPPRPPMRQVPQTPVANVPQQATPNVPENVPPQSLNRMLTPVPQGHRAANGDARAPQPYPGRGPQGTPTGPPPGAHRPYQPAAPPVAAVATAPAPAAVIAPPRVDAPPQQSVVAPAMPRQPRSDGADARPGARANGDGNPGAPTMRTPQSRYQVRER